MTYCLWTVVKMREVVQKPIGKSKRSYPEFNSETMMADPQFETGMLFASQEVLKEAIKMYARRNRVDLMFPINDRLRMRVLCEEDCPFYMWCSQFDANDTKDETWQIKNLVLITPVGGQVRIIMW